MKGIALGAILTVLGAVLPFLMVIGVLQASYLLSFVSYSVSVLGLTLGLSAALRIAKRSRI